jgi:uncharacterized sulfatase
MLSVDASFAQNQPNILFVFIDDMGYADLACYGNEEVESPNIDQLAQEGIRYTQFYVNAPICSPSRVAVTTGQFPVRWDITTYISSSDHNAERGIADFLDSSAPSVAKNLKRAGYYTAHIGKWHMGGGRDVNYAPLITNYGFAESITQFEGLGDRYLATYETLGLKDSTRSLEKRSARLGKGTVHWAKREDFTKIFVDRTIKAIETAREKNIPFYINLWPDDIHTPLEPPLELRGELSVKDRFEGVMKEMDFQMGRLFSYIKKDPALSENTLIVFTSDNGPDREVNSAGHLRGYKTNLYEGGIREPMIIWGPKLIPDGLSGTVNRNTVFSGVDLPLIFMSLAGAQPNQEVSYDGENLLDEVLNNKTVVRKAPLFWIRPPDRPGYEGANDPDLAIRSGDYKLLMDFDRKNQQLYNIRLDESESNNLLVKLPELALKLSDQLFNWYQQHASN